ncbi:MAG: cytochrome c peroxidase [Gemmatimonadaceae bacterium]
MRRASIGLLTLLAHVCGPASSYHLDAPNGVDAYLFVPPENALSKAKIELGRRLFFDRRLSADQSTSCASCHRPERAFSDTAPRAIGVFGRVGRRNAPALINVGYGKSFSWDGRTASIEEQVLRAIQDSLELALPLDEMVARLRADAYYRRAYRQSFGGDVSAEATARALASYLRTLRSGDSPRDRFHLGDTLGLSVEARRGFRLFAGKANCSRCHMGPTLSDEEFHNTGVSFGGGDAGRAEVTGRDGDRGAFNTPTLRDVALTSPYMHDGSFRMLEEVIEFYNRGGGPNPHLDSEIQPLGLTPEEKRSLLAFLQSLTGERCHGRMRC